MWRNRHKPAKTADMKAYTEAGRWWNTAPKAMEADRPRRTPTALDTRCT